MQYWTQNTMRSSMVSHHLNMASVEEGTLPFSKVSKIEIFSSQEVKMHLCSRSQGALKEAVWQGWLGLGLGLGQS